MVYLVVTSSGGCDILMFGVSTTAKRISLGNTSTAIQYKYKAPSSNGENGYLFIYTSNSILDTIVFNLGTYGDTNGILSNSDSTEYNSGSAF